MAGCRSPFVPCCLAIATLLLVAMLSGTARCQSHLHALAGARVVKVRIIAERPILPERIPPLATRAGDILTVQAVCDDERRLQACQQFIDVRSWLLWPETGGVEVVFDVVDLRERWRPQPPGIPDEPWSSHVVKARFQSPDPLSGIDPRSAFEELPQPQAEPGVQVVEVKIVGNDVLTVQKINALIRTRADRPYNRDTMDDDVRRLVQSRMFLDVKARTQPVPGGVVVIYTVTERPMLKEIKFVGNKKIKVSALVKEVDLKVGKPLDPYTVDDARQKLEQLYATKGFSDTRVEVIEGDKPGDRNVVFLIHEGLRQKIWSVKFDGNTIATDARLKTQIQSKPPILWVYKGYVDRQKIEADVDKLTAYYRSLGFFRARIGRELDWNEEQSWLTLRFVIDEGPRYVVRSISVTGNLKMTADQLKRNLTIKPGDFFDQPKMNADVVAIQDEYGSKGYIFANVQAEPSFFEEPGQLDLVYNVEEGDRYRVGRIDVKITGENNPHTRIRTVLNRMSLRPGDVVDTRELRASERRLKASQLFNVDPSKGVSPKIVLTPQDEGPANVAERPSRSPSARGQSPDPRLSPETRYPQSPPPGGAPIFPPPYLPQLPAAAPPPAAPPAQPIYRGQGPDDWNRLPTATPRANGGELNWQSRRPVSRPAIEQAPPRPVVRGQSPGGPNDPWNGYRGYPATVPGSQAPAYAQPPAPPVARQQFGGPPPQNSRAPQYTTPPSYPAQPPNGTPARFVNQPPPQQYAPPPAYAVPPTALQLPPNQAQPPVYNVPPRLGGPPPLPGPVSGGLIEQVPPLHPNFTEEGEPDSFVILTPTVEEARTGRLMFGVGVNSDAGLVGNVVLEEQNFDIMQFPTSMYDFYEGTAFRGAGQRFRAEAVPGTQVQRYMFNFSEPYLFDTPVSFGVSGFIFDRRFRDWSEHRQGGQVSLGYQLSPDLAFTTSIRAQDINIDAARVPTPPEVLEVLGHTDLYTARMALAHDTRDSTFLPTEGHLIELAFEQGFGEFEFPRGTLDLRQFFLIRQRPDGSGRHVLGLSTQVGVTGNNTPVFENFFAGGTTTLRGFRFRGASPVNMGTIVGGQLQILGSAEYLFPLTADDAMRAVVFVDAGTVEEEIKVDTDNIRVAPGIGLRISVPALGPAPIALDLAFPVVKADTDDTQVFSFRVGLFR